MKFKFKITEPVGTSNGFWYDLTDGGYINPEEILEDPKQIERVNKAIMLLQRFEKELTNAELLNEF